MMDYLDKLNDAQDMKYELAQSAMMAGCKELVDENIRNRTELWFESIGLDAWDNKTLDLLWKGCYHSDAALVGQLVLSSMREYLYSAEWETIKDNWEDYSD